MTRTDIERPVGGSSIRIAGYTKALNDAQVTYRFVSPVRPTYVCAADHVAFSIRGIVAVCISIHNVFFHTRLLRGIAYLLRFAILRNGEMRKLVRVVDGTVLLSHQNGSIPLFLKLAQRQGFIYDVHGVLALQREYTEGACLKHKLLFWLHAIEEKYICRAADIINATSESMAKYLQMTFDTHARFVIAPDGLLQEAMSVDLSQERVAAIRQDLGLHQLGRVLFFAGNFKKTGGVHLLTDAFCEIADQFPDLQLLIIGKGQMETYVRNRIVECGLQRRFFHKTQVPHALLPHYQELASLIVCPDLDENLYNGMTPHIKVFDSVASGKPVIATHCQPLEEMIPPAWRAVKYCSSARLKDAMIEALSDTGWFRPIDASHLRKLSYHTHAARLLAEYRAMHILT